jgi:hypothetical protein
MRRLGLRRTLIRIHMLEAGVVYAPLRPTTLGSCMRTDGISHVLLDRSTSTISKAEVISVRACGCTKCMSNSGLQQKKHGISSLSCWLVAIIFSLSYAGIALIASGGNTVMQAILFEVSSDV